jgi:molybdate transport system regulatory protein
MCHITAKKLYIFIRDSTMKSISRKHLKSISIFRRKTMNISARNVFKGTITAIVNGAVNAEIDLALADGTSICSVITMGAVEKLGLRTGMEAYAIIKANSIILGTNLHEAKISARNLMCGKVQRVIDGPVSAEIDIEIGAGTMLSAVITHESARKLALQEGSHVCAIFKASSVLVGIA